MKEIWKDIPDYEGIYQVSNLGNVKSLARYVNTKGNCSRSVRERILKPSKNQDGYLSYNLSKNGKSKVYLSHRLVATSFLPNPHLKPHINHIDGNKENNCLENLEWCTIQENITHSMITGLHKCGGASPSSKKVNQYNLDGTLYKSWDCVNTAAKVLGINSKSISKCALSKIKTYKGFIWRYEQN